MKTIMQLIFHPPSPLEAATKELVEAEHARLVAQSAAEYALSIVAYNAKRVQRLRGYISGYTETESTEAV
jgi:hypothetical protein